MKYVFLVRKRINEGSALPLASGLDRGQAAEVPGSFAALLISRSRLPAPGSPPPPRRDEHSHGHHLLIPPRPPIPRSHQEALLPVPRRPRILPPAAGSHARRRPLLAADARRQGHGASQAGRQAQERFVPV
jgi:hypothetical protein